MPEPIRAHDYHHGTQHPDGALMDYRHVYLPAMRPVLFKRYRGLPAVELPIDRPAGEPAALSVIGAAGARPKAPDLGELARVLHYSAGVTKLLRGYRFRAAACTGALYHIELYVVCSELEGLPAGAYHYDPEGSRLHRLRQGDWRVALAQAAGESDAVRGAPVTLVYTDVYWRNAIKYQARAYRHSYWDSGTILANTLSMASALGLGAELVMGFADPEVARLLGLDATEELPLALLALGAGGPAASGTEEAPAEIRPDWEPRTGGSQAFPVIPRIHRATSLDEAEQVRAWRRQAGERAALGSEAAPEPAAADSQAGARDEPEWRPLVPPPDRELPEDSLERIVVRRGSSRAFARAPIDRGQLAALLDHSIRPIRTDYPIGSSLVHPYLIVHAVDGLEPGVYQVRRGERLALRQLRRGEFRRHSAQLALGQALGGDAAANLYFLSGLAEVVERYGERGYRLAQMEAAIMAGWAYLAAYALGIGATGLTFYDELVEGFLGVADAGLKVMFLLAIGVPAAR